MACTIDTKSDSSKFAVKRSFLLNIHNNNLLDLFKSASMAHDGSTPDPFLSLTTAAISNSKVQSFLSHSHLDVTDSL